VSRPTRTYALFIAIGFLAAAVLGAFTNNNFSTGAHIQRSAVLHVLDTNGWHNLFHLAFVPLAVWVANRAGASATFAIVAGAFYGMMGLVGLGLGNNAVFFGLLPLNIADSLVHLSLGILGVAAAWYAAAARRPQPRYASGT
jgi:p-aminobenzoyl-glutamate transporter AbgT